MTCRPRLPGMEAPASRRGSAPLSVSHKKEGRGWDRPRQLNGDRGVSALHAR